MLDILKFEGHVKDQLLSYFYILFWIYWREFQKLSLDYISYFILIEFVILSNEVLTKTSRTFFTHFCISLTGQLCQLVELAFVLQAKSIWPQQSWSQQSWEAISMAFACSSKSRHRFSKFLITVCEQCSFPVFLTTYNKRKCN